MRECFWERLYLLVISWDGCWRRLSRHHRHHNKKPSGNHSQDTHQKCPLSVYKWFQTGNEYLVQEFPTKTRSCTKFIEWILTIKPKPGCRYLTNAISLCFWKPKSENSMYVWGQKNRKTGKTKQHMCEAKLNSTCEAKKPDIYVRPKNSAHMRHRKTGHMRGHKKTAHLCATCKAKKTARICETECELSIVDPDSTRCRLSSFGVWPILSQRVNELYYIAQAEVCCTLHIIA